MLKFTNLYITVTTENIVGNKMLKFTYLYITMTAESMLKNKMLNRFEDLPTLLAYFSPPLLTYSHQEATQNKNGKRIVSPVPGPSYKEAATRSGKETSHIPFCRI